MSKHKETMSNVDTAWLHMERPTNLMMICSFMTFDEPIDFDRLMTTIERRLLAFDRFRQRVVPPRTPVGNYTWELDPHFDVRSHLHRVALPAPGDKRALEAFMSDLISTPLDLARPLWQFVLVEGYGQGCVVACRLHHSIADGIALMRVLLSMTDLSPDAPLPSTQEQDDHPAGKRRGLIETLMTPAVIVGKTTMTAAKTTRQVADLALHQSLETLRHPSRLIDAAKVGTGGATKLVEMVLRSPDPQTIFKGELGVAKRATWSDPLPLTEVKRVGKALGGTINDTLLAVVAGALRRYLQDHDQPVDGVNIRALVPVNLRPLDAPLELGNRFGLIFPTLPVGVASPHERFFEMRHSMNEIKESPEAVVAYGVLNALGMTPTDIEGLFLSFFATKSTAVMTNVPGPQVQLYLAGSLMREMMAWVPQSGGLGMGVSIISYNGGVMIGVTTDAGLVPDPEQIITNVHIEFETMRQLADTMPAQAKT